MANLWSFSFIKTLSLRFIPFKGVAISSFSSQQGDTQMSSSKIDRMSCALEPCLFSETRQLSSNVDITTEVSWVERCESSKGLFCKHPTCFSGNCSVKEEEKRLRERNQCLWLPTYEGSWFRNEMLGHACWTSQQNSSNLPAYIKTEMPW